MSTVPAAIHSKARHLNLRLKGLAIDFFLSIPYIVRLEAGHEWSALHALKRR